MKDLEAVYDAEIAPLMEQIIAIATRCDMPFVAAFQLNDGTPEEPTPLLCTSVQLLPGCARNLRCAGDHVLPDPKPVTMTMSVSTPRGGTFRDN